MILQNSELIDWEYAKTIGKLLFWVWIHSGSWPKWLDQIHMRYIINGRDRVSCKRALRYRIPYLYILSEVIRNNGWQERESDLRYWLNENGLGVSHLNDLCILKNSVFWLDLLLIVHTNNLLNKRLFVFY